jgi:hypothetical protein
MPKCKDIESKKIERTYIKKQELRNVKIPKRKISKCKIIENKTCTMNLTHSHRHYCSPSLSSSLSPHTLTPLVPQPHMIFSPFDLLTVRHIYRSTLLYFYNLFFDIHIVDIFIFKCLIFRHFYFRSKFS